jgi:hypothetical protein
VSAHASPVLSPDNRRLLIALMGVLALVFAFVASNVAANHQPKPHNLPVGVVGPPQAAGAVAAQLERKAPGAFEITAYGSPATAQAAILHRRVYGAFEPGPPPSLLVASAASVMRDVAYFNGHGATHALLVLGAYAILGAIGAMVVYRLRTRAKPATA